jgi:hypothetical protein
MRIRSRNHPPALRPWPFGRQGVAFVSDSIFSASWAPISETFAAPERSSPRRRGRRRRFWSRLSLFNRLGAKTCPSKEQGEGRRVTRRDQSVPRLDSDRTTLLRGARPCARGKYDIQQFSLAEYSREFYYIIEKYRLSFRRRPAGLTSPRRAAGRPLGANGQDGREGRP